MFASPLIFLALAIPVVVTAVFGVLYLVQRNPLSQPAIIAAIPLSLSSIAILLARSTALLLQTFQEIATNRTGGVHAVAEGLLSAQQPLGWCMAEVAASLLILLFILAVFRYSRDDDDIPLLRAYVALPALFATSVVIIAISLTVYYEYDTVDLVMKIVDTKRNSELVAQYGSVPPSFFASKISSRLVFITFFSAFQIIVLILTGALAFFWRQKGEVRSAFATVLTFGSVISCGLGALSEFGFIEYLKHMSSLP